MSLLMVLRLPAAAPFAALMSAAITTFFGSAAAGWRCCPLPCTRHHTQALPGMDESLA
jgi:hypothetical protein